MCVEAWLNQQCSDGSGSNDGSLESQAADDSIQFNCADFYQPRDQKYNLFDYNRVLWIQQTSRQTIWFNEFPGTSECAAANAQAQAHSVEQSAKKPCNYIPSKLFYYTVYVYLSI
jgi:hypothetical protein